MLQVFTVLSAVCSEQLGSKTSLRTDGQIFSFHYSFLSASSAACHCCYYHFPFQLFIVIQQSFLSSGCQHCFLSPLFFFFFFFFALVFSFIFSEYPLLNAPALVAVIKWIFLLSLLLTACKLIYALQYHFVITALFVNFASTPPALPAASFGYDKLGYPRDRL